MTGTFMVAYCPYCGTLNTEEDNLLKLMDDVVYILSCKACKKDSALILYDYNSLGETKNEMS